MPKKSSKYLVIVGDDFGYSEERDDGMIECFKQGGISTVSVMVNGYSVSTAVKKAKEAGLTMDLHLNLTEGRPISAQVKSSITNEDGFMLGKMGFRQAVEAGKINLTEVRQEIQAQIDKFIELTGERPVKVDGHQHVHVVPGIYEVFGEVLRTNDIKMSRVPVEAGISNHPWSSQQQHTFMESVVNQSRSAQETFTKCGIWAPNFIGLKTMGANMNVSRLQSCITSAFQQPCSAGADDNVVAADDIICELMVHPGNRTGNYGGCGNGPDNFSKSPDREHEMNILISEEMLSFYRQNNISLKAFHDFVE